MFPFDRTGIVHVFRIGIEFLLILYLFIFGTCRCGTIVGFNNISSLLFLTTIFVMASTDIYYLLLAIFTIEIPRRETLFHMIFYTLMSSLALICCIFSIITYAYCIQHNFNRICSHHSCKTLWISITLTFILTFMYTASVKFICCLRERNSS